MGTIAGTVGARLPWGWLDVLAIGVILFVEMAVIRAVSTINERREIAKPARTARQG
jgi:hypothetical protein